MAREGETNQYCIGRQVARPVGRAASQASILLVFITQLSTHILPLTHHVTYTEQHSRHAEHCCTPVMLAWSHHTLLHGQIDCRVPFLKVVSYPMARVTYYACLNSLCLNRLSHGYIGRKRSGVML